MKLFTTAVICLYFVLPTFSQHTSSHFQPLFDGKSFKGWEGDTQKTWSIENGMITGGSLTETVPHNEFLCTTREYANFILKARIKLTGDEGFINSGIQFRSIRLKEPPYEMRGYQADWGEKFWVSLYDESRRDKTLIAPDSALVHSWIKINDWNEYEIHAEGRRIRLYINGNLSVDYTEPDPEIPQNGLIGLQIHGGGEAKVYFKDLMIRELP